MTLAEGVSWAVGLVGLAVWASFQIGSRDGFFRGLKGIAPGDVIELDLLNGKKAYRVERTWVVDPEEVDKRGVKMVKDGQPAELTDFREGDRLSATIITSKPPKVMTEQQVNATLAAGGAASGGAAPASGARASSSSASRQGQASQTTASSASAGAAPRKLPKTASSCH